MERKWASMSNNTSPSNSKSEDISLDDLLSTLTDDFRRWLEPQLLAWHKAEVANLLQVIEDEVDKHDPSTGRTTSKAYWGNTLRQALKKLKDNAINGGSL
jgi:hypothetical protein